MLCKNPDCRKKTIVIDKRDIRSIYGVTRRRRMCIVCGEKFTTYEITIQNRNAHRFLKLPAK